MINCASRFRFADARWYKFANLLSTIGGGWKAHPSNARLYMGDDFDKKRIGAFCSSSHDAAKSSTGYLQVDLGQQKTINYIATQGKLSS